MRQDFTTKGWWDSLRSSHPTLCGCHSKNTKRRRSGDWPSIAQPWRGCYDRGVNRFEREAYERVTGRGYFAPPGFENVPYVCLRLPTGGGKTLLASTPLGTIGDKLLGTDRPACLWITPNTTIRNQTLRGLAEAHASLRRGPPAFPQPIGRGGHA